MAEEGAPSGEDVGQEVEEHFGEGSFVGSEDEGDFSDGDESEDEDGDDDDDSDNESGDDSDDDDEEEEDEGEDEDEGEEMALRLDNQGRAAGVTGALDYSFRAFISGALFPFITTAASGSGSSSTKHNFHEHVDLSALPALKEWQESCKTICRVKAKDGNSSYSRGSTYFIAANAQPRCALEQLALVR